MTIDLANADELLSTTRAVRKRLDLTRPVPREVILDCIRISQQAPTGSNAQTWRWIVVTDPAKKKALSDIYREVSAAYFVEAGGRAKASGAAQTSRVFDSASYLAEHMHEAPMLVIPCMIGRPQEGGVAASAGFFASIYPAVWNFNLALRGPWPRRGADHHAPRAREGCGGRAGHSGRRHPDGAAAGGLHHRRHLPPGRPLAARNDHRLRPVGPELVARVAPSVVSSSPRHRQQKASTRRPRPSRRLLTTRPIATPAPEQAAEPIRPNSVGGGGIV